MQSFSSTVVQLLYEYDKFRQRSANQPINIHSVADSLSEAQNKED